MKKVAILQSSYIPWKGYFDIIRAVDEFILFDDVQYTRRNWRNRNIIKTSNGLKWLTIPVQSKGHYTANINEIVIADSKWKKHHWNSIMAHYSHALNFHLYEDRFKAIYLTNDEVYLSKINYLFIKEINSILNIKTKITWSSDYISSGSKTRKLLDICKQANASIYISGPSAKSYFDEDLFYKEGMKVHWVDYSGYSEYQQLFPPFEHKVTILDLIFNEGPKAVDFMKTFAI